MAKFEEYAERHVGTDGLSQEIEDAQRQTEEKRSVETVPDRFAGKTREEIAAAWVEADKAMSRQGNELGELRRTVNDLSTKLKEVQEQPKREPTPVTIDELYEDPNKAIRRVVEEDTNHRIEQLEQEVKAAQTAAMVAEGRRIFETKHPNYKDTMTDPDFLGWIKGSNIRVALASAADQGNFEAADELFSTYKDLKQVKTTKSPPRSEAARQVALERSGGGNPAPNETYSRHELQEKRIAAQRGDRKAAAWLAANADSISSAYAEGRLSS